MNFDYTPKVRELESRLTAFMDAHVYPNEGRYRDEVAAHIRGIDGVLDVHHFNIWAVCSHIIALSAHVEIEPAYDGLRSQLLHTIEHELQHNFHITHTTIQLDCSTCSGGPLFKELSHTRRHGDSCGHEHH